MILHGGRTYADGAPHEVLTEAMLESVYGIEAQIERDGDGLPRITPLRSGRDTRAAQEARVPVLV